MRRLSSGLSKPVRRRGFPRQNVSLPSAAQRFIELDYGQHLLQPKLSQIKLCLEQVPVCIQGVELCIYTPAA
jgi:hypothetical protein